MITANHLSASVLLYQRISVLSQTNDLPVALHFHLTCIDQSNFKFCEIKHYKFSLYLHADVPNKLTLHSYRNSVAGGRCNGVEIREQTKNLRMLHVFVRR